MRKITLCLALMLSCCVWSFGQLKSTKSQQVNKPLNLKEISKTNPASNTNPTNQTLSSNSPNFSDPAVANDARCGTMPGVEYRVANDPAYAAFYNQSRQIAKSANQAKIPCDGTNSIVVPVAFHFAPGVVTCGDATCLLAEVQDQLDAMNLAFGDNTGTAGEAACPAAYLDANGNSVASTGTCISFCLAIPPAGNAQGLDPACDPPITIGEFTGGFNAGGNGAPGWGGIMNLFIVDNNNCLGVADGIPGSGNGDGVSTCATAFGGFGGSAGCGLDNEATYNLGATMVHEIGHYLGLFHTHVDGAPSCNDNDVAAPGPFNVNDTPIMANQFYGCPTGCVTNTSQGTGGACGATNVPTANFMAYTDDACMTMFTEDQAQVMNYWANQLFGGSDAVCSAASPAELPNACLSQPCSICNHTIAVSTSCDADGVNYTATVTVSAGTGPFVVTSSGGGTVSGAGTSFTVSGISAATTISVDDTGEANCVVTSNIVTPCCAAVGFTAPAAACSGETITLAAPATCGFTGTAGTTPLDAGATGTYPIVLVDITPTATPNLTTLDFSALDVNGFLTNNPSSDGALVFPDPCADFEYVATNTTCDVQYIHFIVTEFTGEAGTGAFTADCQSAVVTVELFPQPNAPTLATDNCQVTLTGACPDDVVTIGGGNGSGTSGNIATYDYTGADDITIDIANANNCATAFTFTTPAPPAPVLTCPATASCGVDAPLSADLVPEAFGTITVEITGTDTYLDELSFTIDGTTIIAAGDLPGGGAGPTTFGPVTYGPFPVGTYTFGVDDTYGDGLSFPAPGSTLTVTDDASGAVIFTATGDYGFGTTGTGAITASILTTGVWSGTGVTDNTDGTATFNSASNGTFTTSYTYTDADGCEAVVTCDIVVSDCAAATYCDNICFAEYNASPPAGSVPDALLCVTPLGCADSPDASCLMTDICDDLDPCTENETVTTVIETGQECVACGGGTPVVACSIPAAPTACDDLDPCTENDMETLDSCDGVTVCVPCAGTPVAACSVPAAPTACDDGDPCTENDMETLDSCDGVTVCVPCAGQVIMPSCGDPTATNYDMNATCIDNTICTYGEYCDNICYAEFALNPGPNDVANFNLCVTALGCADSPDASCIGTQICDDADPCTAGEMETYILASGVACGDCGLSATPVTPACGDATATNYDATATCIDNTLCTYATTFGIGTGGSGGFGIADPCACNGDETYNNGTPTDVGTFNETIYIGTPTGMPIIDESAIYNFTVTAITANPAGIGNTAPTLLVNATLTWDDAADGVVGDGLGFYTVVFDHTSNSGYQVMIDVTLDANGDNVGMLTIGNQCAYPSFALTNSSVTDNICADDPETNPDDNDSVSLDAVTGGGISMDFMVTNTVDPEAGNGSTTFIAVTTDDDGNMGVAPNNGANGPAYPSISVACAEDITLPYTVVETDICAEIADIPTVGEWGLIMLGLMMSIVAIVGIRERKTNEIYS